MGRPPLKKSGFALCTHTAYILLERQKPRGLSRLALERRQEGMQKITVNDVEHRVAGSTLFWCEGFGDLWFSLQGSPDLVSGRQGSVFN